MTSDNKTLCQYNDIRPFMVEILKESNLYKRLHLYQELYKKTNAINKPFVAFHIRRTQEKIDNQDNQNLMF